MQLRTNRQNLPMASALQARRAYEKHFGTPMRPGMTYQDAANELVTALGQEGATRFIQGMSNDPKDPE